MRIVNICNNDWANFAHDNAVSLRAQGVDCDSYVKFPHVFGYKETSTQVNQFRDVCKRSDLIQVFHSCDKSYRTISHLGIPVVVVHAGSHYRDNHRRLNTIFQRAQKHVYALGEFETLVPPNSEYMVGSITIGKPKFQWNGNVAHYPSRAHIKGTDTINEVVKDFDFNYLQSTTQLPYLDQLQRMDECDVYIELCKPDLNGRPYGSWGITALEAASLGKVVITSHRWHDLYQREYGEIPFMIANNKDELKDRLNELKEMSESDVISLQKKTYKWVKNNHSHKISGERWMEKVIGRS